MTETQPEPAAAMPTGADPAGAEPSYEEARDELVEVVRRLEAGAATLEESLQLWERGERLARICERRLEGARARLAQATATGSDGHSASEPDGGSGESNGGSDRAAGGSVS